ncbi:hypothetical protein [Flavobacterium sp. KACC 22761]|uniref:hypothetical protein n=1 Tax=Flavobacterium sp. KACC 22761 TaxID=3092665 RepID=UPI002A74CBB3|nr:hypothetical protein [Flavobacterium sp. KACC 22761]WPO80609.1 hypothetical protein SCB73_09515 [Flavobacterium sp. KACC 22761]
MIENKVKIYTLIKLISFIKFESREPESKEFAASPIVGEILSDLLIQFNSSIGKEFSFAITPDNRFGKTLINSIKSHLKNTDEWNEMSINDKKEYINDLASPYLLEEQTIYSIMNHTNT